MIQYSTVFISVLIGLIPTLVIIYYLWLNKGRGLGVNLIITIFFLGVLTAVPASIFQIMNIERGGDTLVRILQSLFSNIDNYFISQQLIPFTVVSIIEEFSKGFSILLSFYFLRKSERASKMLVNPGLIAGVIVGLAFGVTENGVYFANNFVNQIDKSVILIIFLRFVLSTSAHIIYSGLFGAFLADMFVSKNIPAKIGRFILAILLPITIHTGFNILVSTNLGPLSIPWLLFWGTLLGYKLFWPLLKSDKEINE
jgi:RsiW-degrading membrane proteinase PrsW (M82 family)